MGSLVQDLRYFFRQMAANPAFAAAATISLALGIGATTAVFSVIYATLIDPYPYPGAERIVRLTAATRQGSTWINLNGPQVRQIERLPAVASVLAMGYQALTLTAGEVPENVNAIDLIGNAFRDLGVPPVVGRGLAEWDSPDGQEPAPVVVLSHKFWRQRYFSDPGAVGKTLELDHKRYTIVGVAAPRFTWYSADVYLPLKLIGDPANLFIVDLRLKPGVPRRVAEAQLQPLMEQYAKDMPKHFPEKFRVKLEGLNDWVEASIGGTLDLLLGGVGLLLAIGCANVSILLMARGTARWHELAMRAALGARGRRIARQLLTEAMALGMIGAAAGVAMSYGLLAAIRAVLPKYAFAPEVEIRVNLPVMVFSAALGLTAGIASGLWPALRTARSRASLAPEAGARRVAGSVHGRRTHNALIAGQIALTMVLLAGAGSAVSGFRKLLHEPLGYDPHNIVSLGIPLRDNSYTTWAGRAAYFEQLRAALAETPGVTMTAISSNATPPRNGWYTRFEIEGQTSAEERMGSVNLVNPDYFRALRIPLAAGRIWTEAENRGGARVAVINRTLAERYFPSGDAIGHSVRLPGVESRPPAALTVPEVAERWLEIVGVVADAKNDGLRQPVKPAVYVPYTLAMSQGTQVLVRSAVPPATLDRALRRELAKVNPEQQAYDRDGDLETWIREVPEWQQEHLAAWIFSAFAGLALALAALGLSSVVSYTVEQRTDEFGIRLALGAGRRHLLGIVFASVFGSVGTGAAVGIALALMLEKWLGRWSGGESGGAVVLAVGTLALAIAAALACVIPAWRATAADPAASLRAD